MTVAVGCGPSEEPAAELHRATAVAVTGDSSQGDGADLLPPPRFETLTVADGLVSNEVNVLHQDREGFLWVGTFGGLSRFDGASFVTFLHDPADPMSLGHNAVNGISEGRDGEL